MRIGIDARCLIGGKRTGVEEYTINLLENIFSIDKDNSYILFLNSFKKLDIDLSWVDSFPNVEIKHFHFPNKLLNLFFWYLNWPKVDKMVGGIDAFFMPNINFVALSKKTKLFLTIHDLSFEYYPETFSWKRRMWHLFINPKRLAQKADKIIAVSESTAKDLAAQYGIAKEKIHIIYSGISNEFHEIDGNDYKLIKVKEKYKFPFNAILFLGTIEPRKNIVGIVRAYNQLRNTKHSELEKYKLVIAGSEGWKSERIFSEIQNSPFKKDILFIGLVENKDKPLIYNLSSLFVYPSFFEGFGFPPLEAMRCGVPTIVSNNSSLPEVISDAGIMIDPDRPDEIFQSMKEILTRKNLHSDLREKGLKQSRKFVWRKAAQETISIFN